ncbi:hypothetical protein AAFX33_20510 [Vibrio chagasii]|uniref:hypothetical protein n=1 Tax=Vibrio chagasii TaxID=170679 RepID=UPI0038CD336E
MEKLTYGISLMRFLLNDSSYGGDLINKENAETIISSIISKVRYLEHIHKHIDCCDLKILVDNNIYTEPNCLSDSLNILEISRLLRDQDESDIFINMFSNYHGLIQLYSEQDYGTLESGEKITHINTSISMVNTGNLGVLSFDIKEEYKSPTITIDGVNYFNVPSVSFNEDLSFLYGIHSFYQYFLDNYIISSESYFSFDIFEHYHVSKFFFEFNNNYSYISSRLTKEQNLRQEFHPIIGDFFAKINGFSLNEKLTNQCSKGKKRVIYNKKNCYISLDFQHFEFEKHAPNGKHLGSIRMFKGEEDSHKPKLSKVKSTHHLKF